MPLIGVEDLDQDLEDKVLKPGKYNLVISSVAIKRSKKETERPYIAAGINFADDDEAAMMYENINLWVESDEPKTQRLMARNWKRFMVLFAVPNNGAELLTALRAAHETNDFSEAESMCSQVLSGATASCQVGKEEAKDTNGNNTGEFRNKVMLPKLAA